MYIYIYTYSIIFNYYVYIYINNSLCLNMIQGLLAPGFAVRIV